MDIKILSPEKTLYEGEIKSVKLEGLNGRFEILNNHAPIVTALVKSEIIVKDMQDEIRSFAIKGGIIEMSDNKINILVQ
ncbi:MAG: F0F1 ATP synthase subunit epsilon [Bacteroidales bacterium]|nr:F0F1 ATP synthase subunit epsilon [Bacteroidales bacterium]